MNNYITGKLIKDLREKNKMTQQELATKINVSDKTISKWECGKGLPDVSLMMPLCKILGITVNELLSGNIIDDKNYKETAEGTFLSILKEKEESKKKLIISFITAFLGAIVLVVMILLANYVENDNLKILLVIFGIIVFIICFINAVILDYDTGIYECKHCKYKFKPELLNYLLAPHIPLNRYLKCPKCGTSNYCKHKLFK